MLSAFFKKLMFARQLSMTEGRVNILGKPQIILPINVLPCMCESPQKTYEQIKGTIKKDIKHYAQTIGSDERNILNNVKDIYEIFGLGKLVVFDVNGKTKTCRVRVVESPYHEHKHSSPAAAITPGILAGMFSYVFAKDIECGLKPTIESPTYKEFVIK